MKKGRTHNSGLAIGGVSYSADTFVVVQQLYSASTFMVKCPPIAKPQNVMGKFMKRHPNGNRQTREPTEENFDSS